MSQTQNASSVALCDTICQNSSATLAGAWVLQQSASYYDYIAANLTGSAIDKAVASIKIPVAASGNYTLFFATPGCKQDNTCNYRGLVTVAGYFESEQPQKPTITRYISQTNEIDKYDGIYEGFLSGNTSEFTPFINVTASLGSWQNNLLYMVAYRVSTSVFTISTRTSTRTSTTTSTQTTSNFGTSNTAPPSPPHQPRGSTTTIKTGLGVGIPLAFLILIGVTMVVARRIRSAKLFDHLVEASAVSTYAEMSTKANIHEMPISETRHELPEQEASVKCL